MMPPASTWSPRCRRSDLSPHPSRLCPVKGSFHSSLQSVDTLVLSAGHGDGDPGACHGPHREADQAVTIVKEMAILMRPLLPNGALVTVPYDLGLKASVRWINERYSTKPGKKAWCIEIHRDSADTIKEPSASLRCGLYRSTTCDSVAVANAVCAEMVNRGADSSSWVRSHQDRGSLHWIAAIRCMSHILELGFMEGSNDPAHLSRLARIGAAGILKAFAGVRLS